MSAAAEPSDLVVLVSVRIDPTSARATRSPADAAAVALAQMALGGGSEPWLCTAGDMPDAVARDYLAQGVSQLTRLRLGDGAGLGEAVSSLARVCSNKGLVLAGPRGESGTASGLLPYALAQRLQWPLINEVVDLQRDADGSWRVVQALARGARRSWRLEPGVAAVLVTSPRLAQREDLPRRHAWLSAQAGAIVDQTVSAPQALPPSERADWIFEPARKQRRPLAAASTASGAARMAQATGSGQSEARGGTVIRDGSAEDKARALLEHLRRLSLVQPPA